ncbi:hypothetical protein JOL62DRAFT_144584 [Phyllosticta paracitricarpa]|uniref:DNA recombination and repair protein Rad51-like C-terminal domain-containing protein n=1 Tax=Phyllosticta paracitricarpa TaxID=2016321 RepID=A0ABR1NJ37_9PEZI
MPGIEHHNHPIQPLLASDLFSAAKSTRTQQEKERTRTGCKAVDGALKGGIESGQAGLVAVTGDKGSGRTALAFALLSSHLLSSPTTHATLIDTASTFDVARLYTTLLSQLRQRRRLARAQLRNQMAPQPQQQQVQRQADADAGDDGDEEEEAERVLDRVYHARVFDFVGMVDAVTEVRERLERQTQRAERGECAEETSMEREDAQMPGKEGEKRRGLKRIRSDVTHIDDTDDEVEEDDDDDADAMVIDATGEQQMEPAAKAQRGEAQPVSDGTRGEGMIVVDSISHIVGPMMKTNHVQTSAVLSSFLRSLKHLTTSHNLTTLLINGAIVWNASRKTASSTAHPTQPPSRGPTYASSIFSSSSHIIPALSPMLAGHVDLHLLLTVQPLSHGDAVTLNSTAGAPFQAGQRPRAGKRANQVGVLEVLSDRYGDRVGRWGPFIVDSEGIIVDVDEHGRREER